MKIPYTLLDFSGEVKDADSQWDMTLIMDMLRGDVWNPAQGYEFEQKGKHDAKEGAVLIIPARQNASKLLEVQSYINELKWCVLILSGDEERSFDYTQLVHDNMKVWLMQPTLEDKADYYLGSGYSKQFREFASKNIGAYESKSTDWFFAGQNNHPRREEAARVLRRMLNRDDIHGDLLETEGFTQGISKQSYAGEMVASKAVPAPSGIQSPDSFRVYEALEAGAVPIADDISSVLVHEKGYWEKVFNDHGTPFKVYDDAENLEGYIMDVVREYPAFNNRVFAWWQAVKRDMVIALNEQIHDISGIDYPMDEVRNKITVIVLTSPIKSNPDTRVIDECINSIRHILPDAEILIGMDGVRPEQEHYRANYEEFKKRLLWKTNYVWDNVIAVPFDEYTHQAMMTKKLLTMVKTPTILFVEHDMIMTSDNEHEYPPYEWNELVETIEEGTANIIRFHFEAVFPEEHIPLMLDNAERQYIHGVPMIRTVQYSQRPFLASTAFYRDLIDRYFTESSRTFIEDRIHGLPVEAYQNNGITGWNLWRIWIYAPEGSMKRCHTIDGREDDPKYEMEF